MHSYLYNRWKSGLGFWVICTVKCNYIQNLAKNKEPKGSRALWRTMPTWENNIVDFYKDGNEPSVKKMEISYLAEQALRSQR